MPAQKKKGVEVHVNFNDVYNKCVVQKEMRDLQLHTIDRVTPHINDNKVFLNKMWMRPGIGRNVSCAVGDFV